MHIPYRFTRKAYSMREQRLVGFSAESHSHVAPDRDELLRGASSGQNALALNDEDRTEQVTKELENTQISTLNWITSGFDSSRALAKKYDRTLYRAACEDVGSRTRRRFGDIFRFGRQRKLSRSRKVSQETLRKNVLQRLQDRMRGSAERRGRLGNLINRHEQKKGSLRVNAENIQTVTAGLRRLGQRRRSPKSTNSVNEYSADWTKAAGQAQTLGEQLRDLEVVTPGQFRELIRDNQQGGTKLEYLIRDAHQLDKNPTLRSSMKKLVRRLRTDPQSRDFLLLNASITDLNGGTIKKRLQRLKNDPVMFMREIRFKPKPGSPTVRAYVTLNAENGNLVLEPVGGAQRYVINTDTGTASYTTEGGGTDSWTLNEDALFISE